MALTSISSDMSLDIEALARSNRGHPRGGRTNKGYLCITRKFYERQVGIYHVNERNSWHLFRYLIRVLCHAHWLHIRDIRIQSSSMKSISLLLFSDCHTSINQVPEQLLLHKH